MNLSAVLERIDIFLLDTEVGAVRCILKLARAANLIFIWLEERLHKEWHAAFLSLLTHPLFVIFVDLGRDGRGHWASAKTGIQLHASAKALGALLDLLLQSVPVNKLRVNR